MTPEQKAVHERLLQTLPSKIHGNPPQPEWVARRAQKKQKPVIVFGKRYESIKHAAADTGFTAAYIWQLLKAGKKNCSYIK